MALQELENMGQKVLYVTSQIASFDELTAAYVSGTVLDSTTALFSPIEIILPNFYEHHHLSFEAQGISAKLYSDEGTPFLRKYPNRTVADELAFRNQPRSTAGNRTALSNVAAQLLPARGPIREIADRFDDPVINACVLAFLVLDTQLVFSKPKLTLAIR